MARKKKEEVSEESPNIAFVGGKDGKEPLPLINNGSSTIVLPADQSKPFFHVDAKTIIRLFPWLYKKVVDK
jgi:hypothetical protein